MTGNPPYLFGGRGGIVEVTGKVHLKSTPK